MIRGERFEVDLGEDDENTNVPQQSAVLPGAFVNDILERKPAAAKPPTAPTLKSKTGFPEHGERKIDSRFRQRQNAKQVSSTGASKPVQPPAQRKGEPQPPQRGENERPRTWEEEERVRIDRKNNDRLADMTSAEIEQERRELMSSLSPEMIQKLLQRSSIESGSAETDLARHTEPVPGSSMKSSKPESEGPAKKVAFAEVEDEDEDESEEAEIDTAPPEAEDGGDEAQLPDGLPQEDTIHFPRPSQPPDLDPSSSTFLTDLHTKYFPSLPSDPEKLEWMQSTPSTTDQNGNRKPDISSYDPSAPGLEPAEIRFDFRGALLPPSTANQIPVTAGLHHHGLAPEAAGYTIPELLHLARSSFAPQRCIAFQTLGRLLFRLGKGEFGDPGEPQDVGGMGVLARGLWREMDKEKVTVMLVRESEGLGVDAGRHVSARAYATEAVWLWQRGGGRRLGAE